LCDIESDFGSDCASKISIDADVHEGDGGLGPSVDTFSGIMFVFVTVTVGDCHMPMGETISIGGGITSTV
jgi:hypothetical protein